MAVDIKKYVLVRHIQQSVEVSSGLGGPEIVCEFLRVRSPLFVREIPEKARPCVFSLQITAIEPDPSPIMHQ